MPAFLTPILGLLFSGVSSVAGTAFNGIRGLLGFAPVTGAGGGILGSLLGLFGVGAAGGSTAVSNNTPAASGAGDFLKSPLAALLLGILVFFGGYYLGSSNEKTKIEYRYIKRSAEANAKADEVEREQTKKLNDHNKKMRDIVEDVKKQCSGQKCTLTPALIDRLQQLR
jgi:hypothetical protein